MTSIEPAARRPRPRVDRLIGGLAATRRWLLRVIAAAAAAAAFLIYALLRDGLPGGAAGAFAIAGIVAALAPPFVLLARPGPELDYWEGED